jgi:hypothetical protein
MLALINLPLEKLTYRLPLLEAQLMNKQGNFNVAAPLIIAVFVGSPKVRAIYYFYEVHI